MRTHIVDITEAELTDLLENAIAESFDVDWNAKDGAEACVRALKEAGAVPSFRSIADDAVCALKELKSDGLSDKYEYEVPRNMRVRAAISAYDKAVAELKKD